ncbi:hypothetical protein SORBI_3004G325500 [Sorghum bicolor]|uniref:PDZ domain-containing protein n=1 Tax=Sorghum bicolor TaxID=4558 RepID=A0A1Z5RQ15_SORBI|nr:hypothetical protein SORBI_3004G325500 [Sorghum bicolor]
MQRAENSIRHMQIQRSARQRHPLPCVPCFPPDVETEPVVKEYRIRSTTNSNDRPQQCTSMCCTTLQPPLEKLYARETAEARCATRRASPGRRMPFGLVTDSSADRTASFRYSPPAVSASEDPDGLKDTDSSDYSSPLRRPKSLLVEKTTSNGEIVYEYNSDQEVVDAYHKDLHKYQKKLARQQQLPTLKECNYARNITDWDNLNQKNAILDVAESVLRLSSSHDGKEINSCNGIIIEWDESDKSAIVLTSSQIIATKVSLDDWEDNNVYVPNAKVTAHLLDGTISDNLTLLYFSKHYEVAFFKLMGGSELQVASLEPKLEFGSEACVLAREKDLGLICRETKILALDPCDHQRNHYLFIGGSIPQSSTGGPLTDFNRKVVGMVVNALPNFAFIPSSIIITCFRLWQSFKKIARPHLGLKLRTVQFLDITHLEQLSRDFKIRDGLIVGQVSSESLAERNGFRTGDIIFSCQGETVLTISEFEGILLDICAKQFEEGKGLNDEVDVELGVYKLRKPARRRMVTLSVQLSDCMEAFDY